MHRGLEIDERDLVIKRDENWIWRTLSKSHVYILFIILFLLNCLLAYFSFLNHDRIKELENLIKNKTLF